MTRDKLSSLIQNYQDTIGDEVRDYIGASSIGSDCLRQIWYQYKGVQPESVPAKIRRTWAIGKRLEGLIIEWLFDAEIQVQVFASTLKSKIVPFFQGHIDAMVFINGEKSILEIKTAKDASFNIFIKKGLKAWNPQYYAQVQSYIGMCRESEISELNRINSAYILVLNKDTSDISDELVLFDEDFYLELEDKALSISSAVAIPPKINGSPLWYQCKTCKFKKVCHQ
jgi:hypothetical protein